MTVDRARARATEAGFELSCDDEVGALMAALAAGVPRGGRILELGTGVGVGLAWMVAGLQGRTDVEVHSVEIDAPTAAIAAAETWPSTITLHVADAMEVLPRLGSFDLIFADAQGGKIEGLDLTISALAPGGHLLVDDMAPKAGNALHESLWPRIQRVRERLLTDPRLRSAELTFASGVILATKLR
ncbi:MAG: class I SAM-dependent methyltransferase [Thermoleophilia bacterium]